MSDLAFYSFLIDWRSGGCQRRRKCILCFCHNFEKTIALNSDKSLQTSNPSSRLTNFSSENKTLQELPILPFTKILGQSNVNNVFLFVVPFTSLVSLVYAVSLVIFFVSVVVSIVFVYFLYFIILESLLSRVSLPCL